MLNHTLLNKLMCMFNSIYIKIEDAFPGLPNQTMKDEAAIFHFF